ncbi:TetR family transcriptional regulator [Streptomyces puniciscabiei]
MPRTARATRTRILHAAGAVLAERGYEAATVPEVAAALFVAQDYMEVLRGAPRRYRPFFNRLLSA